MAANNTDSVVRGAVARRACQGREWVSAIDAHCISSFHISRNALLALSRPSPNLPFIRDRIFEFYYI
ncbi:hypothetical protein Y032_0162g3448 [Ancylostoma ceylanicum]|uniref:Uncharacterized protein n=1 Tax=Ancylostoma ceylanicum TaxID=53326 RepID=A0A016SX30_9BILA|nr:hypothetical protein Y032_0162g3448 [Ancylostoma ceylanicum]